MVGYDGARNARDEERRVVAETGTPPAEDAEERTSEIPTPKVPRWLVCPIPPLNTSANWHIFGLRPRTSENYYSTHSGA